MAGFQGRRLLATVAQVEALRLRLTGPSPVEARLDAASLAGGQGYVVIADLVPGSYSLQVDALGAGNAVLGTKREAASVSAGVTTAVAVNLQLDPETVAAQTGGLQALITLR
ncbi:MAG: hypothetical protein VKP62_01975 [Candidatus Sericytochromatia bacterium]|nr:hypothetical protein [Candidatus Sericytochromatia bacterium]